MTKNTLRNNPRNTPRRGIKGMNNFDVIIIGAGGVGLAAAMYSALLGLKTLVLGASHGSELPIGGVITSTNIVENYPGFIRLTWQELSKKIGVKLNEKAEIIINHKNSSTNVKGIFAAGDVTDKPFKQLITGVADGCTAAYSAYEYISKNKIILC